MEYGRNLKRRIYDSSSRSEEYWILADRIPENVDLQILRGLANHDPPKKEVDFLLGKNTYFLKNLSTLVI